MSASACSMSSSPTAKSSSPFAALRLTMSQRVAAESDPRRLLLLLAGRAPGVPALLAPSSLCSSSAMSAVRSANAFRSSVPRRRVPALPEPCRERVESCVARPRPEPARPETCARAPSLFGSANVGTSGARASRASAASAAAVDAAPPSRAATALLFARCATAAAPFPTGPSSAGRTVALTRSSGASSAGGGPPAAPAAAATAAPFDSPSVLALAPPCDEGGGVDLDSTAPRAPPRDAPASPPTSPSSRRSRSSSAFTSAPTAWYFW